MESPPKMSHDSFTFRFPARLWRIINSCSTGAISWGPNGKTVRILRKKFEEEYLTGDAKPFKTAKYESFVRQLNHYGFKKVKKRSAVKKISTPIMNGENKEEAAMLSEYHNPNFTRGQPERVTFLERRSQLHDDSGHRKRNKRGALSTTTEVQENGESNTTGKKMKKESSVQVSHSQALLTHGAEDDHSSSVDDNSSTKSTALSRKSEKVGVVATPTVPSSAAVSGVTTRHLVPPYQSLTALKSISPAYQRPVSEGRSVGIEERLMYQHRPYYSHDGLDPRYARPSLPAPFTRHVAPSWRRPFQPCQQTPLYDHYLNTWANMGEPLYGPYGPESRHLFQPLESDLYPPLSYFDNRYGPHIPPDAWEAVYRMNRGSIMPGSGGFHDSCSGQQFVGQQMRWSHKNAVSTYQYRMPPPHGGYLSGPDPLSSWPQHQCNNSSEARTSVQSKTAFFTSNTHSMQSANGEVLCGTEASGHDASPDGRHDTLAQSQGRSGKSCTYSEGGCAHDESADTCQAASKWSEEPCVPGTIQEVTRDISTGESALNGLDYQEQSERLAGSASSKNEEEGQQDYSDNIHIITDDAVDLPLDVAEETVVTCNATGSGTSRYCSPITQYSSAEDKILMDTLNNSNASFPPEETPASFHLPTEDGASSSRQHYHQVTDVYTMNSSDVTPSPSFTQHTFGQHKFPNNLNPSQDGPEKPYPTLPTWGYSDSHQTRPLDSHYRQQEDSVHAWPSPASHCMEDTAISESGTVTSSQVLVSFTKHHQTVTENGYHHSERVSAPNHTAADRGSDYSKPSSAEAENGHARARVLVQREERGDLTQLSSTSVQELLSAALRTPGMKILVDENCHPEKMVLVIPKGKRREVGGCV